MISCLDGEWLTCAYLYCSNVSIPAIPAYTNKPFQFSLQEPAVNGTYLLECLDLF